MNAISTTAQEQPSGITEANTSVNYLDRTTQHNAAMVEELAAAGAGLKEEGGKLTTLLPRFQIEPAQGQIGANEGLRARNEDASAVALARVKSAFSMIGALWRQSPIRDEVVSLEAYFEAMPASSRFAPRWRLRFSSQVTCFLSFNAGLSMNLQESAAKEAATTLQTRPFNHQLCAQGPSATNACWIG